MSLNDVEVCLSPELIHLYELEGKVAVVVDILRATSCFVAGLSSGVEEIVPFLEVEPCRQMRDKGYVLAGERNGLKVEGFDIGNSPEEYIKKGGSRIAVTTTNGTRALNAALGAEEIVVGSFLNLASTSRYLIKAAKPIVIVCAGWKGRPNTEDSLYGGALASFLKRDFEILDDNLVAWKILFDRFGHVEPILQSSHVKRLNKLGIRDDIDYCLLVDEFETVVKYSGGSLKLQ